MPDERKLFYYDCNGHRQESYNFDLTSDRVTMLVSEIELPEPDPDLKGRCAYYSRRITGLRPGEVVDLAFGDPIVLEKCEFVEFSRVEAPQEVTMRVDAKMPFLTLRYKGKLLWVRDKHVCLLKDLQ
jgi:hypothetical protein